MVKISVYVAIAGIVTCTVVMVTGSFAAVKGIVVMVTIILVLLW